MLNIETLFVELQFSNGNFLVGFVYRPPNNNLVHFSEWLHCMDILLEKCHNENKRFILLGDFNIDLVSTVCQRNSWINTFQNYNLTQIIKEPTRITSESKTLIDHIYVSDDVNVSNSGVLSWSVSDHNPVYITVKKSNCMKNCNGIGNDHKTISYRKYTDLDIHSIGVDMLHRLSCITTKNNMNIDKTTNSWTLEIGSILDQYCPKVTKRIKRDFQPAWLNPEIRKLMKQRDLCKSNKSDDNYKTLRNKCKKKIKEAKSNHYVNLIETNKNDPKILTKIFQELGSKNNTRKHLHKLKVDDKLIECKQKIGNVFNQHFASLVYTLNNNSSGLPECEKLSNFVDKNSSGVTFKIPHVSHGFVFKYLCKIKISKATGFDEISARFLKLFAPYLTDSITKICNLSITENRFPSTWKTARVIPLLKKGSTDDVNNYRPISILPVVSKILEKHVSSTFYAFLNEQNLLNPKQSGFRSQHSCQTALTLMTEEWLKAMNKGELTGVLMVDLCKAFDLVDHSLLLHKLKIYRCSEEALDWFTSYLSKRTQKVDINGQLSHPLENICGVPQGSVLGPLFFIVFINDMFLYPELDNLSLFADDATAHHSSKCSQTITHKLQAMATSADNWCEENKMKLSIIKTKVALVGSRQRLNKMTDTEKEINIFINDIQLEQITHGKLLGIHIDESLTWNLQVANIKKIVVYKLFLLKRIRTFLPTQSRIQFYNYYVKPYLEYCCSIWGSTFQENINTIVKLQKRAARLILDADFSTPSAILFQELKWISFSDIVKFHQLSLIFKCINKIAPVYLQDLFHQKSNSHSYVLRSSNTDRLDVPRQHTRSLSFKGPQLWNKLNNEIRNCTTLTSFQSKLTQVLLMQSLI